MQKIVDWVKKNRFESFFLATIILIASFLRLYKIDEYMTFLGDEGRDALVVRRLLVNFDPILVGPGTSIGNMYLGPLYYYLMAPFLLLAGFSPVGPSVMVALFGILTVFFVWYVGREWFGKLAGFIGATLYAVSPVVITYSRSSWNPNIMPFFSLLCIYSIWRVFAKREYGWLIVLGISFAMVLNSHYLGLLLTPTILAFWIFSYINTRGTGNHKVFIKRTVWGVAAFLVLMSPLFVFDARHEWRNLMAIETFFSERQTTVSARPWTALPKIGSIWMEIDERLLTGFNQSWAKTLSLFTGIFSVSYLLLKITKFRTVLRKPEKYFSLAGFFLLFIWIFFTLVGFGVYKQEIYDHYYGIIFPAVFILIGAIFQKFTNKNKFFGGLLALVLLPQLIYLNVSNNPLKYSPNNQLQRSENVAGKIIEESKGKEFNIAVIAERNYEGAYQYFLEKREAPVIMIDPQRANDTITNQLFVVCELPPERCDPTHDPKAGIANFGWSKIDSQWKIDGVIIYKLIHSK